MKASKTVVYTLSADTIKKLAATLTESQRKTLEAGLKKLEAVDPQTLHTIATSHHHVVLCSCGPSGEPGLIREW